MKISLLGASLLASQASAYATERVDADVAAIPKRATPQAPNGYTPANVDCPSDRPTIRVASGLSDQETEWLKRRRANTVQPLKELLGRLKINGYDTDAFIERNSNNATALPNVGLAFSGGGYRALMNGAGALAAMDSRTNNATSSGHIGGLLQASTYIAGLSGGSWLVGSLYTNNFTSVQAILDTTTEASGSLWQFENSILAGPARGGIQILDTAQYFSNLHDSVDAKSKAGFDTSLTDYWSRALSFQLVNASDGGPALTFSSIAQDPDFSNANAPMPIIVADEREPGQILVAENTTVFEFNPWEMGSYDPTLYAFAPLKYAGSRFNNGQLPDNESCVAGFDNAAFIMGTSSSLFNQFFLNIDSTALPGFLKDVIKNILGVIGEDQNDISDWTPNPFRGFNSENNPNAGENRLTLVDGGEDLQNIPLHPLIQPVRAVDVIFAVDSSADTITDNGAQPNWPNGTALVETYRRSLNAQQQNGTAFPSIPDQNTFVNLGLNNRPTFFGCDANNITGGDAPLVVYLPNSPFVFQSNVPTFDLAYNNTARNAIIQNGYLTATRGNSTFDRDWPSCVACAIMARSFHKSGERVPDTCTQCFSRYCWDGTVDSRPAVYNPVSAFAQLDVADSGALLSPQASFAAVAAVAAALLLM